MAKRITDISLRQAAIVAGVGLLIMAILAPFAEFSIRQSLIVPGDAATTAKNIMAGSLGAVCFSQTGKQKPLIAYGLVQSSVCRYSCYRSA